MTCCDACTPTCSLWLRWAVGWARVAGYPCLRRFMPRVSPESSCVHLPVPHTLCVCPWVARRHPMQRVVIALHSRLVSKHLLLVVVSCSLTNSDTTHQPHHGLLVHRRCCCTHSVFSIQTCLLVSRPSCVGLVYCLNPMCQHTHAAWTCKAMPGFQLVACQLVGVGHVDVACLP